MKYLTYILLFITLQSQAQITVPLKEPNAYRMIATNIGAVALDAIGDGLRDKAWATQNNQLSKYGHIAHVGSTAMLLSIPLNQRFDLRNWVTQVATYTLTRMAIFDPIYNYTRGMQITYIGDSSYWDKILKKSNPPDGFMFARAIIFTVSVSIPLQYF